ncbi:MAG: glycerophosphodiester phosphodiesterase [Gemmatimonadales bacterium]
MTSPLFPTAGRPFVIGHRGAPVQSIENSLPAFHAAAALHRRGVCDGVELDIQTTADGKFVVHHDAVLRSGEAISSVPLSTVRASRLADGSPVPTLAEALDALEGVEVFIEAKSLPRAAGSILVAELRARQAPSCHVHAFDHRIIARLRHLDAELLLGVLSQSYPVDPVGQVREAGATTLWQEAHLIDEALVVRCHRADIALVAWTVNDAERAAQLSKLGVDGLCGDWPDRLRPAP